MDKFKRGRYGWQNKTGHLAGWTSGTYTLNTKEAFHQLLVNGGSSDQVGIDFAFTGANLPVSRVQFYPNHVEIFVQSGLTVI